MVIQKTDFNFTSITLPAPPKTWSRAQTNIWSKDQGCANLGAHDTAPNEVQKCKASCEQNPLCTAINFNAMTGNCVHRKCSMPVPPPEKFVEGYRGYYMIVTGELTVTHLVWLLELLFDKFDLTDVIFTNFYKNCSEKC